MRDELNPRHSVFSQVLRHELIFQYCESGRLLAVQLHSLELSRGVVVASTGLPTVHHEASQAVPGANGSTWLTTPNMTEAREREVATLHRLH